MRHRSRGPGRPTSHLIRERGSGYARTVGTESRLAHPEGYPFEVRYSDGAQKRATAVADVAAAAYVYFNRLFSSVEPDFALIVADKADWLGRNSPYGLPFFTDEDGIRAGVVVMPAGAGDFWIEMARVLRDASPREYVKLVAAYPDGAGGVDLQPFFDLITIHELAHAFETLGDLRLPTSWLSEIFVNLAMHAFVATQIPESLPTLKRSQLWEREVKGLPLGFGLSATARLRISKPTTRAGMTR